MSAFRDIMSIVDPTAAKAPATTKQPLPARSPKPAPRPLAANGTSQTPQLKRKASGPVDGDQVKVQRKELDGRPTSGSGRSTPVNASARPNAPPPISTVPYRGTAAPGSAKPSSPAVRKAIPATSASSVHTKPALAATKPASAAPAPAAAAPKKGYLALLQKAKEKDASKPAAPPIRHEPQKFMTRKERLALKAEAAANKGKKPSNAPPPKATEAKGNAAKDVRKPAPTGYQGTARPAKEPVKVEYKGTARPGSAAAGPASRNGPSAARAKPGLSKGRYDGYADWDDLDDMDDEEEDYASDGSSDMEGGMWDVEEEEQLALKQAKREDAEALAEENRLKAEKLARKKKLMAMSQAAAAKRKY